MPIAMSRADDFQWSYPIPPPFRGWQPPTTDHDNIVCDIRRVCHAMSYACRQASRNKLGQIWLRGLVLWPRRHRRPRRARRHRRLRRCMYICVYACMCVTVRCVVARAMAQLYSRPSTTQRNVSRICYFLFSSQTSNFTPSHFQSYAVAVRRPRFISASWSKRGSGSLPMRSNSSLSMSSSNSVPIRSGSRLPRSSSL